MAATIQTIQKPTRARALDTSGNNNHGQIYSGRGLEFDGVTDYLDCGTAFSHTSHAICVWAKITADGNNKHLFGARDANNDGILLFYNDDEEICYYVNNTDMETTIPGQFDNTWVRIVATSDGSTQYLYINGVLHTSQSISETVSTTTNVKIGARNFGGVESYFNGALSDLQAWNTHFTAADALYDYNNPEQLALNRGGTSLTNSNLLIWYPMNDGHRGQQSYILDASNTGLGDELVDSQTDRDFSGSNNWALVNGSGSATMSTTGGQLVFSGSTTSDYPYLHRDYVTDFKAGDSIRYELVLSDVSGGTVKVQLDGGANIATGLTSGTNVFYHNGTSGNALKGETRIVPQSSSMSFKIDSLSLKPINDKNHATTVFHGDELVSNGDNDSTLPTINSQNLASYDVASFALSTDQASTETYNGASAGSKSIKVTADGSSTFPLIRFLDGSDCGLETGKTYTFSAYVYLPASQTMDTIKLQYNDGSDNLLDSTTTTNSWVKLSGSYVQDDQARIFEIRALSASGGSDVSGEIFYVDQISIKEQGTASGWTDADQQLDIPQTALQSYNQLAMPHGASNHKVDFSDGDSDLKFTTGNHSFSFWFCPQSASNQYVLSKGAWGTSGYYIYFASTRKLQYHTNQGSSANQYNSLDNALTLGKWYHCVVTISDSGTDSQWYINGEEENKKTDHIAAVADTRNLQLYNRGGGSNNPDSGLTELSVWNKTLSQSEVNELYNDGIALDCRVHSASSDLLHYWRNGGLATWTDIGNAGSLYNGTPGNITETMLIASGADGSRDSQGFLMNRQRATNSLNLDYGGECGGWVDLGSNTTFAAGSAFSITLWLKPQHLGDNRFIGFSPDYIRFRNTTSFRIRANSVSDDLDVASSMSANEWVHIAIVRNTSNLVTVYQNGAAQTDTETVDEAFIIRYIGAFRGTAGDSTDTFKGELDDICIYEDELSAAEVKRNYNAGKRSHR